MGPSPLGPKETDGLPVPPGKAYTLLTDHLMRRSEPAQEKWFMTSCQTIHTYKPFVAWMVMLDVMTSSFWVKVPLNGGNIPT